MDFIEKYTCNSEEKILLRKINDLVRRSRKSYKVLYSHFLTPAEQLLINKTEEFLGIISFDGGYSDAERKICRIQTAEYEQDDGVPYVLYLIRPTAANAEISHRDVLGAIMGLGVKREMIGDIMTQKESAMFFCDKDVAAYIEINLDKIGRYKIEIKKAELTDIPLPETKKLTINISSPRIDSICAGCFGISRTKAAEAIRKGLVSINWQVCDNISKELSGGEKISMRGRGKVRFVGITGTSKKGRAFAEIEKYV